MQRESSIILDKVLLYIPVNHKTHWQNGPRKVLGFVWSRTIRPWSERRIFHFCCDGDFVCKMWWVPGSPLSKCPWSLIPDRQTFPFRLPDFPGTPSTQGDFSGQSLSLQNFQGVLPTSICWQLPQHGSSSGRSSPRNFSRTHCVTSKPCCVWGSQESFLYQEINISEEMHRLQI